MKRLCWTCLLCMLEIIWQRIKIGTVNSNFLHAICSTSRPTLCKAFCAQTHIHHASTIKTTLEMPLSNKYTLASSQDQEGYVIMIGKLSRQCHLQYTTQWTSMFLILLTLSTDQIGHDLLYTTINACISSD